MDVTNRRELARRALDGYVSGPAASTRATARALAKVDNAVAVVLVEGISDQIAMETAAVGTPARLTLQLGVLIRRLGQPNSRGSGRPSGCSVLTWA
jgi:hypothetical protein